MSDDISFQTWICPKCCDDHGQDNYKRCANNLVKDLEKIEKANQLLRGAIKEFLELKPPFGTNHFTRILNQSQEY